MQGKHLFEYAVIRIVPKVEREEFLNAGVILYCKDKKFLQMKYNIDEAKVRSFCDKIDMADLHKHFRAFKDVCDGVSVSSPIATLDIPSRFRWLTAKRSTIVQTSQVHPGLCISPDETLADLFEKLVM
jgi:hypothetical protein